MASLLVCANNCTQIWLQLPPNVSTRTTSLVPNVYPRARIRYFVSYTSTRQKPRRKASAPSKQCWAESSWARLHLCWVGNWSVYYQIYRNVIVGTCSLKSKMFLFFLVRIFHSTTLSSFLMVDWRKDIYCYIGHINFLQRWMSNK